MTSTTRPDTDRAFFIVSGVLVIASAALTAFWHGAMPAMNEMSMCGDAAVSMVWIRMPGQTWTGAAASFLAMWTMMMVAMMLPSLIPMLWRYRHTVGADAGAHRGRLTLLAAVGYFSVWVALGLAVYPLGALLAVDRLRMPQWAHALPLLEASVVIAAGLVQFSRWKTHHLAYCREAPAHGHRLASDASSAWRHGLRLGLCCVRACAGPTAVLLVMGVMDLHVMAVATAVITAERLAPSGIRAARIVGTVAIAVGLLLLVRVAVNG